MHRVAKSAISSHASSFVNSLVGILSTDVTLSRITSSLSGLGRAMDACSSAYLPMNLRLPVKALQSVPDSELWDGYPDDRYGDEAGNKSGLRTPGGRHKCRRLQAIAPLCLPSRH